MKKFQEPVITEHCLPHDFHTGGRFFIVRGVGKRAIKIVLRNLLSKHDFDEDEVILKAAIFAAQKNYRTVVVEDHLYLDEFKEFNNLWQSKNRYNSNYNQNWGKHQHGVDVELNPNFYREF